MNKEIIETLINNLNKIISVIFFTLLFSVFILLPENFDIGHYSLKTSYFSIISIITTSLLIIFNIRSIKSLKIDIIEILLCIYSLLILVSTTNSNYIRESLWGFPQGRGEGIFTLYSYLLCFYISSKIYNKSKLVENLTTISVVIISGVGILQALIGRYYGFAFEGIKDAEYMSFGTMINPNFFSTFITIFLPIFIISYLHNKDSYMLYIIGILFGALVCSKSLGGYLTFIIYTLVVFIYFIIISKNKKTVLKQISALLILFITVFILLNGVNDNKYFEELNIIKDDIKNVTETSESFGNNRGYIWSVCFEIVKDNWLFGIGPDSLGREVISNYMNRDDYIFGELVLDKAHNEYLHIAVTTGIPSLLVYILILGIILFNLVKKFIYYIKNKELNSDNAIFLVAISASILAYLVQGIVNISVTCVAPLFWCILGIGYNIGKSKLV